MTADTGTQKPLKQSVWFVRYGLTEHPLVEDLGPYDSDIDPGEGIDHAMSIAKRIAAGVNADETSIPGVVYASPFLRTAHTGYIIANELQKNSSVELRLEEGLWEWLIPSLLVTKVDGIKTNPRPLAVLKQDLQTLEEKRAPNAATINIDFESINPYNDSGDGDIVCVPERQNKNNKAIGADSRPPIWIESEANLLDRCETTLSRLIELHQNDAKSICIVSHAPCDQAMAHYLEKQQFSSIESPKDSKLSPWPLGGVTVFSRSVLYDDNAESPTAFGDWTMELYGDTEHMPGDYKTGLKEWSLPCFA